MNYKKIKPEEVEDVIRGMLEDEYEIVEDVIDKSIKKTRTEARKKVKELSNRRDITTKSKHYADDWTTRLEKTKTPLMVRVTVHNRQYPLTHLLEHGHFIFNQHGGACGRTRSFPHVRPTQDMADEMFENEIIKRLEKL